MIPFERDLADALLQWFDREGEDYPWTRTTDPWAIWVSEVMLQQTTVGAVAPRYLRWLERFPTSRSLAEAGDEEILREWEGLGYYSRARNMASAAREIEAQYGGQIPDTYEGLKRLPGLGNYTAAAVASFAFGERTVAIDANGRRIAMRLAAEEFWSSSIEKEFRSLVEVAMPAENPGRLNAALMQFGQKVCTPKNPHCSECPAARVCLAKARNLTSEIPRKRSREVVSRTSTLIVALRDGLVFIVRRTSGIGRGLWVFPRQSDPGLPEDFVPKDDSVDRERLTPVMHAYTRYRENLIPLIVRPAPGVPDPGRGEWVTPVELGQRPMPTAYRRIADELTGYLLSS